jgi:hypothetical protein
MPEEVTAGDGSNRAIVATDIAGAGPDVWCGLARIQGAFDGVVRGLRSWRVYGLGRTVI